MSVDARSRLLFGGCLVLLLVSTLVNVLQAERIQALLVANGSFSPVLGTRAIPITGLTVDGRRTTVAFDERRPTLLYYFSSTCGWCERNWANVRALHDAAGGRYRVVAVSMERGLLEYTRRHRLDVDVIEGISENVRTAYGFSGTPHTALVDDQGVVTHEWRGAFNVRITRQLQELFSVTLPGVQTTEPDSRRE